MTAIDDIAAERRRHIEIEGWSYDRGELAMAAALYASPSPDLKLVVPYAGGVEYRDPWPWKESPIGNSYSWRRVWYDPKDRRRDLVRAGALIVAEIERLDRADASRDPDHGQG